jgi:hypothetical protein
LRQLRKNKYSSALKAEEALGFPKSRLVRIEGGCLPYGNEVVTLAQDLDADLNLFLRSYIASAGMYAVSDEIADLLKKGDYETVKVLAEALEGFNLLVGGVKKKKK